MRVGFASIYAWRPHVEHMMFLAGLVRQAGHESAFLACDADLPACYTRELRDVRPDWMECLLCRVGGVRSYAAHGVSSVGDLAQGARGVPQAAEWAGSSASTLGRFESAADYESAEFALLRERMTPAVALGFQAASEWIRRERLDAVCLFNGRIDATRGILEAARAAGIRVVSFERSWFGDGIQLLPDEGCLGLRSVDAMVGEWAGRPLTGAQAREAAGRVASRLAGTNVTEWRAYNANARSTDWPLAGRRRILLLPGSLNEFWGVEDWRSAWRQPTDAYDAVMDHLGLSPEDVLMRCHPNWGERIGKADGRLPEGYYTDWARRRGVRAIGSREPVSTMNLIAQCDAIVLASGSAALEAAAMGRQVIATAPSTYQRAGFRTDVTAPDKVADLRLHVELPEAQRGVEQRKLRRLGLRFCYTTTRRQPQYVDYVRALSSAEYRYPPGANPQRLVDLLQTGQLRADDARHAPDEQEEDEVLAQMEAGNWKCLLASAERPSPRLPRVQRRWLLRPVDYVRARMPVGDR